ncbi:probable flap endonuclease 1 homolog [Silurus meridionalis]|uniref:probable flap endonuclease 1 homolog n=1 Tax=Silurus meridionalis TaxID=175797 RepID=UPI001EEAEB8E|nr:probable flap endonuclease 1 homolog [Silurus meridionalis]
MGITKLSDLIRGDAPASISHKEIGDYSGKIIALDTSIIVNQFRSAVPNLKLSLLGVFYRTLTFLEHDIKPVFVFDGDPPEQKRAVLERRAQSAGWSSTQRPHTVSSKTKEFLRLLQLLGVPCVQAPGDAEACCAQLVRSGVVDAVASEDMDTLAFGGTLLLRQLNAKRQSEVMEFSLPKILQILQLTQEEFVDLCILLGCDYCDKIVGLGPSRALKLIQQHRTIENILLHINGKTHPVPVCWQYQAARRLFLEPPRSDPPCLQWCEPNEQELVNFLCQEKHLSEEKVRGRMKKFHKNLIYRRKEREEKNKGGIQTRLDKFFRVTRKRQSVETGGSTVMKSLKTE